MSDLRIALIAEGPTDLILIEAALKPILGRPFLLQLLQPEATRPFLGNGWGGVAKWCYDLRKRGFASIEEDPTLELFDLVILHLDADVAHKKYRDVGESLDVMAQERNWKALPCPKKKCPPAADTAAQVVDLLQSWLEVGTFGAKTVACIPSKTIESWLAVVLLPEGYRLLRNLECPRVLQLPRDLKISKLPSAYRKFAEGLSAKWAEIRQLCTQAEVFHQEIDRFRLGGQP